MKNVALTVLILGALGGCTAMVVSGARIQAEAERKSREAWVGHAVFAKVSDGLFSEDYIIEGTVVGWTESRAMIREGKQGKIYLVYPQQFRQR
jgi:hypothetical protein